MSDSFFSSGTGKAVIYYAAADGVGQRVTLPAALLPQSAGLLSNPRHARDTESLTAGRGRAGKEEGHEESHAHRFRPRGGATAAGGARLQRGRAADEDPPVPLHGQEHVPLLPRLRAGR